MNTTDKEQIWESLHDSEFREQFINEHIAVGIAFQIRALRDRQKLTQVKLAELLKAKQSLLSTWENPNYGKYSLKTLKDLAKAFDVGLLVRFVPFSKLVDWTVDLPNDVIAPPSFGEDHLAPSASTSSGTVKDRDKDMDTVSEFVNSLPALDRFPSTAIAAQEEIHA